LYVVADVAARNWKNFPARSIRSSCTSRGAGPQAQLVAPSRGAARSSQIVAHLGLDIGALARPGIV
jgi:hypothetical protein